MSNEKIKRRWPQAASQERLTHLLGLPSHEHMQDWELECANSERIEEFLSLYESGSLTDDDRFAVMALIVFSFDDWLLAEGKNEGIIQRVRQHLSADFDLHVATIHYWCCDDESNPEYIFTCTPFMREILAQHT